MALSYHELIVLLNKATAKERELQMIIDKQREIMKKKSNRPYILSKL
jgi:hypothetical protein